MKKHSQVSRERERGKRNLKLDESKRKNVKWKMREMVNLLGINHDLITSLFDPLVIHFFGFAHFVHRKLFSPSNNALLLLAVAVLSLSLLQWLNWYPRHSRTRHNQRLPLASLFTDFFSLGVSLVHSFRAFCIIFPLLGSFFFLSKLVFFGQVYLR